MKKALYAISIIAVILVLFFGTGIGSWAISIFEKKLASMGQMSFADEVDVVDIRTNSLSKVTVVVQSKTTTVAGRVYSVYLYLDNIKVETPIAVSWTAGEIPSTKKNVSFTGLTLASVTLIEAEVVY